MRAELWGEVTERPTYQHVGYGSMYRMQPYDVLPRPLDYAPGLLVLMLALKLAKRQRHGGLHPKLVTAIIPLLVASGWLLRPGPPVSWKYLSLLSDLEHQTAQMDAFVLKNGRPMTLEEWEEQPGGPPEDNFGQPYVYQVHDTPGFDDRRFTITSRYGRRQPSREDDVHDVRSDWLGADGRYRTPDDAPALKVLLRGARWPWRGWPHAEEVAER